MAGIAGLSTMTARFPATADDSGDRSGTKIAQSRKLGGQQGTLLFQFRERLWHAVHLCTYYIRSDSSCKKRKPANCHSEVAHPTGRCKMRATMQKWIGTFSPYHDDQLLRRA